MRKTAFGLAASAMALVVTVTPSVADDTGVAQMLHSMKREGKRLCLESHFHDGYSSSGKTKKAAELEAIKGWAEFTAWEYGTDWAYWTRAASKSLKCTQEGAGWGCHAQARPCK